MPYDLEYPSLPALHPPTPAEERPAWLAGAVAPRDAAPADHDASSLALVTGHLSGFDAEGRVLFAPEGAGEPIPVAIGIDLGDGAIVRAVRRRRRALAARTSEATPRWILVGLVRERVSAAAREAPPGRLEVAVDGEKVKLEADHDIELRCGRASITLRYDGRIELRGTHILSASRGPNRVKGATIALN